MQTGVRRFAGLAVSLAVLAAFPAGAAAASPSISLATTPSLIRGTKPVTLAGQTVGAPSGSVVDLYASPFPYGASTLIATAPVGPNGSFSYVTTPDRDTVYRAVLTGTTAQATAAEHVIGVTKTTVRALSLGRAEVSILVFHPRNLHWNGAAVRWAFGPPHRTPHTFAASRTLRRGPYATLLRTIVTLPAGRFAFSACFRATGAHALDNPERPARCAGRGYRGGGKLPVGFPTPAAVARAGRYLAARTGRTAFAIVDSEGRISGLHVHRTFITASVIKAMLLVAYLRRLSSEGQRHVDLASQSFLYPMIHVSDNSAASHCWSIVGDSGLYALARVAGMTDFSISGDWAQGQLSPADQARFFFEMDSLIPRQFVGYARFLLSTVAAYESWGIPAVARPRGYRVFFKGGWRGTGLGQLVHQIARLEGHGRVFSIAVMTDGDPSMGYGIDTIQGVTASLLG
jgi:hypothetical protein